MTAVQNSRESSYGLDHHGIQNVRLVHWNLPTARLYEEAVRRHEGWIAHLGPLVVRTGQYTGRSPRDKFIVREPTSEGKVWWGDINQAMEAERFERLRQRMLAYLEGRDLFVQDCFVGNDPRFKLPIRVITETAWHGLLARNLFVRAKPEELQVHRPELTVIHAPHFHAVSQVDGTRGDVFIAVHFGAKLVLIGGTPYGGEIKKAVFTVMNYLLPQRDVLTMHSSANTGESGDVVLFFGLSGTGKTTLSTDPERHLIGDDEHGWSDKGIFNLEGGCYAKVIRLSSTDEPEIYETTRRFGTILENVAINPLTARLNLEDDSLTENTRAAYPLSHIPGVAREGMGGHPAHLIMLTADAFGVLPPVSKLTAAQAMYHFLSGYTAKIAGTERGVTEPKATFSPCFGAPFMALPPIVYARLLGERISRHSVHVWLVNTGWTGGPCGTGKRIPIALTRAMVHSIISGKLDGTSTRRDPTFGVDVPTSCPGVPAEVLDPRGTWPDGKAYDAEARKLATMFADNFRPFAPEVPDEVRSAGPVT